MTRCSVTPHRVDPNVDYKRLHELSDEFTRLWKRLQTFYMDASFGFTSIHAQVAQDQTRMRTYVAGSELDSEEFQNTLSFSYTQIFSEDFCTPGIHQATQGEVKARNSPDGSNFTTLGQVCLVSFYDFWNDYLRREYAIAKGKLRRDETDSKAEQKILREHASHDLWGDLRHIRQSIVHNQGVATSNVGRCKLIRWFSPGDTISITSPHMRAIFLALLTYRNELFKEQFPPHYIQIPPSPHRESH